MAVAALYDIVGMPFGEPGAYRLLLGNELELRRRRRLILGEPDRICQRPCIAKARSHEGRKIFESEMLFVLFVASR
jgi:hypothetical protein